ncbi:MAG: hypothetical protein TYPL_2980 [Candidatus Tyloplasma litorale]|nr:MAG: hypothetical protein TYPL_2980 [Mycoplasmatales bacterium]
MKKKVAIMVDSEMGWSEKEARQKGFNFVPIIINWNGKEGYSGVDYTLDFVYKNLNNDTVFKTSTSKIGEIQEEYRRALETAEHVLFIPISKHLSSQVNSGKLAAENEEFKGKITVYDSEFIGPWLLSMSSILEEMMEKDASLEEFIEVLDLQRGNMFGWLFPKGLERLKASGRLSKAAYLAGSLLKIVPVTPIVNGMLEANGVIKTRSVEKALDAVVSNTIKKYHELTAKGLKVEILCTVLGEENEDFVKLQEKFKEKGFENLGKTWLPSAIIGHVGIGGVGAGVTIKK